MLQKKRKEATKFSPVLEKKITEILVTNGRAFEPFVRTFCYKGENVAKNHLGSLVGVFEVNERTEDSAYIVNFLASVAKKEYFAQGKRGPIESFESALHKINIALAELVKHGNVEWLGKLHGALGVIEKNNLHFSATGSGKVLLMRHGSFTDISEGLASTESALHPMKTFAEVASGHLESGDRLLLTSPEIFQLFDLEELEKNALRLEERFPQFMKTALINELDMAGVIYASFSDTPPMMVPALTKQSDESEKVPSLANVFSERAFSPPLREEPLLPENEAAPQAEKNEYIDSKTGHIYIQGERPSEKNFHPFWEKMGLWLEEFRTGAQKMIGAQRRFLRKIRKQSLIALDATQEKTLVWVRKLWRGMRRRIFQKKPFFVAEPSRRVTETETEKEASAGREEMSGLAFLPPSREPGISSLRSWLRKKKERLLPHQEYPPAATGLSSLSLSRFAGGTPGVHVWQRRGVFFLKKIFSWFHRGNGKVMHLSRLSSRKMQAAYQKLSMRGRFVFMLGSIVFVAVIISGIWLSGENDKKNAEKNSNSWETAAPAASLIPPGERQAALAGTPAVLTTREEKVLQPLLLANSLYLITQSGILRMADNTFYPAPADAGGILLAAAMEDLQLLFLSTEKRGLLSFSPITRAYASTTLGLPENAIPRDMGAYLTYLYILESATDQIYRFPRATGGFGERLSWLKEPLPIEEKSHMAVNESIFVSSPGASLAAYFQGRKVRNLEMPVLPLEIQSLFTKPGSTRVYALDKKNKRLLVWSTEGSLERQFFSEEFGQATDFAVNSESTQAYVSTEHRLLSVPLP